MSDEEDEPAGKSASKKKPKNAAAASSSSSGRASAAEKDINPKAFAAAFKGKGESAFDDANLYDDAAAAAPSGSKSAS